MGNNDNENDNNDFNMKTNSTVIRSENNNIIKDILFSNNNKTDISNPINTNNNGKNDDEKEINSNIFHLTFQKELFSDGVLILSPNNNDDNFENKNKDFSKNIDIHDFENLINEFYEIYNNVSNNNISLSDNIKDNFLLEYQYFLEKTSDIFNLYSKLSNEINSQNENIKKYIQNYRNKIKIIYKKDRNIKTKLQDLKMIELFKNNNVEKEKNIYYNDIQNIKNKLLLIKIINNDSLFLTKKANLNQQKYNIFLKEIFKYIINNKKNNQYLKEYSKIISLIINSKKEFKNNEDNINDNKKSNNNSYEQNNKNGDRVDLEQLKFKIDKLKQQYINETSKKEYDNQFKTSREKNKKNKNVKIRSDRNSNYGMNSDENYNNYNNPFTPNGKKINKFEQTSP